MWLSRRGKLSTWRGNSVTSFVGAAPCGRPHRARAGTGACPYGLAAYLMRRVLRLDRMGGGLGIPGTEFGTEQRR
jgi:hypothetical protein